MSKKHNLNFIEIEKEVNFGIELEAQDFFSKNYENYLNSINLVKNFDFSKYIPYWKPSFDEQLTISFSSLLPDETIECPDKVILFANCVDFEEGYVVVKNEK